MKEIPLITAAFGSWLLQLAGAEFVNLCTLGVRLKADFCPIMRQSLFKKGQIRGMHSQILVNDK